MALTVVPRLDSRQSLLVLLDQICKLQHQMTTVRGGQLLPRRVLEGLARSLHGSIHVLLAGGIDRGNLGFVTASMSVPIVACGPAHKVEWRGCIKNIRRVNGGDLFARLGRNKFVVNEEANGLGVGAPIGSRQLHGEVRHDGGVVEPVR